MKKFLMLSILCVMQEIGFAQSPDIAYPHVSVMSPESASMAVDVDYPVSHALAYIEDPKKYVVNAKAIYPNYGNLEEKRVVSGSEQRTAKALGEINEGEVTRTDHYGTFFSTYNPTSTEVGSPDFEIIGK